MKTNVSLEPLKKMPFSNRNLLFESRLPKYTIRAVEAILKY